MPLIYLVGWFGIKIFSFIIIGTDPDLLPLIKAIINFTLFLSLLPSWVQFRWGGDSFSKAIGLFSIGKGSSYKSFLRGVLLSFALLFFILLLILFSPWGKWIGIINSNTLLNAICLGLGVGFAEEVIFRGWLLGEMNYLFGPTKAVVIQAAIFSLVHMRFGSAFLSTMGLLIGLFLLGLVLSLLRKIDNGYLWGCIGLHGGLVSGWFLISSGLVEFSADIPGWLFGPGGTNLNPMGGLLTIFALAITLAFQRTALAIAGTPLTGACNASSRSERP